MKSPAHLRRLAARRSRRSERGQTLVLVALAAVALIALVALGIDLVRLYDARSEAQNAADHAATTASHAVCRLNKTPADAIADGYAVALENEFPQAGSETTVSVTHNSGTRFTAVATKTIDTSFAAVIGIHSLDASATAVGDCTAGGTGSGPGAVWAGGELCGGGSSLHNVEVSGNDSIVQGGTHTNGSFKEGGNDTAWSNTPPKPGVEYVTTFEDTGTGNSYTALQAQVPLPTPRWPAGWDPADQTSAMWDAYKAARLNADVTTDKFFVTAPGVYYSERVGDVVLESVSPGVTTFVLVTKFAPLKIDKDFSGRTFTAHANPAGTPANVIAVSGFIHSQNCDQFAIEKSGLGGTFNGIMWAPNAMVRWSGNFATLNGGVISHAFQMNGNDHRINYDDSLFSATPEVLLLE